MNKLNMFNYSHFYNLLARKNYSDLIKIFLFYFIATLLLLSGTVKILKPENFLNTLNTTLNFLGESIIVLIATILPVIEITLGLLLMIRLKTKEILITVMVLFTIFLLYSIYGTIAGYNVDCGCFGDSIKSQFGVWMIGRNVLLIISVLYLYKKEKMIFIKDQNK